MMVRMMTVMIMIMLTIRNCKSYFSPRFPSDSSAIEILFKGDWSPAWKPLVSYQDICDIVVDTLRLDFSYVSI